jgi:ATP-grasp domain/PGM1 C-terminal domain
MESHQTSYDGIRDRRGRTVLGTGAHSAATVRSLPGSTAHPSGEAWPSRSAGASQRAIAARFARLQDRLVRTGATTGDGGWPSSLVVLPSRAVDRWQEPRDETQSYEERLLSQLFELRDERLWMTYVTSSPIAMNTVDYYLSLLPPRIRRSARDRLTLISLGDQSPRPLTEKLLEHPEVLERIRGATRTPGRAYIVSYNSTLFERDLALALDLPLYGPDPMHAWFGTKSGSRELFALTGIPHPQGEAHIAGVSDAVRAIARLRARDPSLSGAIIKLNDGVSGEGNAVVDLSYLPAPGASDELRLIERRLAAIVPEAASATTATYLAKLGRQGAVVEERIAGVELRSPSAQLQISPTGQVDVISTHDQVLAGRSGHEYVGCRFPADAAYAPAIARLARRVAEHLAGLGVIGSFGVDFVVAHDGDRRWRPYAVEVNLRLGGTTHPFQTLAKLTGGSYDADSASFTTPQGRPRHYVATDHLEISQLRRLGRAGMLQLMERGEIGFDRTQGTGAVYHMLSAIQTLGYVGVTAIAESLEGADTLYQHVADTLAGVDGGVSAAA